MAQDQFIYWREYTPVFHEIASALVDYVGDDIGGVEWQKDGNRWFVTFKGGSSSPSENLGYPDVTMREERWFEVYLGDDHIDVITRDQSPLIQAIADGFVKWALRFWKASDNKEE